uniref:Uncharacterized protein n=1 Tax=Arundo donax TaxID=35708 RepID=A0A0A9G3C9_ARUDO
MFSLFLNMQGPVGHVLSHNQNMVFAWLSENGRRIEYINAS